MTARHEPQTIEVPDFNVTAMALGVTAGISFCVGLPGLGWLSLGALGIQQAHRINPSGNVGHLLTTGKQQVQRLLLTDSQHTKDIADDADSAPPDMRHPNPNPLFDALEARPHRLLVGHTGGGKTTLLHELATGWAYSGQKVMVCDPDAAPGLWPGCRVVGANDDYTAIGKVLHATQELIVRRRQQRSEGQRTFAPVHLVIDEVQDVIAEVPGAWQVLEPILRRGRKIGIHLTLGVQDSQRATLDLDGKTHLLKNMVVADLYKEADGTRVATFGSGRHMQRLAVPSLPDPEKLITTKQAARVSAQSVTAALGDTEKLPRTDDATLTALLASEPPKQETASATVVRDGNTINVYAQATAAQPTKPLARNRPSSTGVNMRQRVQRARAAHKAKSLDEIYAPLGHMIFEDAYTIGKGNRGKAFKAWKKAKAAR